jgi:hypothetical protein
VLDDTFFFSNFDDPDFELAAVALSHIRLTLCTCACRFELLIDGFTVTIGSHGHHPQSRFAAILLAAPSRGSQFLFDRCYYLLNSEAACDSTIVYVYKLTRLCLAWRGGTIQYKRSASSWIRTLIEVCNWSTTRSDMDSNSWLGRPARNLN